MSKTLTLYHLDYCPYCLKVRRAADELGVALRLIDVAEEPAARRYLIEELGRPTVPVLGIPIGLSERLLPESDDIVAYLHTYTRDLRRSQVA